MITGNSLDRFVHAQAPVYAQVEEELRTGRKASHWMWFIFPQIAGLGFSTTAWRYAIADLDEARRYLAHPVLGARLRQCTEQMLAAPHASAIEILGAPDDLKFRSCMTLFVQAAAGVGDQALFKAALQRFFGGQPDRRTLNLLVRSA
ncbi:MAG: DUF1810 domain-containing protein [Alphaproteobacteria bacterium]